MAKAVESSGVGPSWREQSAARQERVGINLYMRLTMCCFAVGALTASATFILQYRNSIPRAAASAESRVFGETLATALGQAAQMDLRSADRAALQQLAGKSIRTGVVKSVSFLGVDGTPLAKAGTELSTQGSAISVRVPVTDEGITIKAAGTPFEPIGSVELTLVSSEVTLPTQPIGQQILYVLAGAFAVSSLLATLYIKNTFRPLRELTRAARRIGNGELDCLVPATRVPLFQQISAALNVLSQRIRSNQDTHRTIEQQLKQDNADLAKTLDARAAQLEAANGRLSGEIAEKEDFLRAVSHDLNAPLRNIGGMVTMLLTKNKDELSEEAQNRLDRIKKNVDVETDLISELLELSRIKSRECHLTLVDTEAILWDLRGMFGNDLKTRNIELVIETTLPALYAEKQRIRQVFQNLIDNAIKYMGDRPTREIRVGCRLNVAEAEFYVRDSGMGIHPEDIQKVFYVFRRGRSEATHNIPGKGVGLASVKSIVESYSGRIWVESQLDVGTSFRFTVNGKFVPVVSGQVPDDLHGKSVPSPTLAAQAA